MCCCHCWVDFHWFYLHNPHIQKSNGYITGDSCRISHLLQIETLLQIIITPIWCALHASNPRSSWVISLFGQMDRAKQSRVIWTDSMQVLNLNIKTVADSTETSFESWCTCLVLCCSCTMLYQSWTLHLGHVGKLPSAPYVWNWALCRKESSIIRAVFYLKAVTWAEAILWGFNASLRSSLRGDQASYFNTSALFYPNFWSGAIWSWAATFSRVCDGFIGSVNAWTNICHMHCVFFVDCGIPTISETILLYEVWSHMTSKLGP